MSSIIVTKEEANAITALKRLARRWPNSLRLFSWSGSLCVMKYGEDGRMVVIDGIRGIPNDGGDPDSRQVEHFATIEYEA